MQSEPDWLEPGDIVHLNALIVEETGEPHSVRDVGLLESAVYRPQQHFAYQEENDAVSLAVTLLIGIARNHPFEQGNKRTAFEAAIIFLEQNGYLFDAPDSEEFAALLVDMIERRISDQQFEDIYRSYVRRLDEPPLDDGVDEWLATDPMDDLIDRGFDD